MISLAAEFDAALLIAGVQRLRAALDDELEAALDGTARMLAVEAKAEHPYQNQTGTLTHRTKSYAPRGRFSRGDLRAEVVADTAYATYVMRHYSEDWLESAFRRNEGRVQLDIEAALDRAVTASGLT